ncbi:MULTISPECIES: hypothetical protein [Bacillus amyloliquefaciens group]|uniref:hypothetical protein n=1 Tax=Bacillus amyloliquefaciens group TaxID=1938374 RepID=UPI0002059A49|nr:hypothetical protein [Bacillus amyloliquefaciens]AEB24452.1 hypothetical protein BAMTA208_11435 [Bacillus amyloliquefaciens TA208]MEC1831867.1 hypothetical protein [Bacillus amyloliquefaciens]MEC1835653.1 hypothetical protein [Bacillus amyloliquefaciens]MEC1844355.1 hypothetical protein [Bacillus amyloliquefaciens]MEC1872636.1 hypothetical protein [Bacillus amyloliquefaciens]
MTSSVEYEISDRLSSYDGVYLKKDGRYLLEVRVSYVAQANGPCNLRNINIHEWLFEIGKQNLDKVKKYEIVTIMSDDVRDQKLVTPWGNLKREPVPEHFVSEE